MRNKQPTTAASEYQLQLNHKVLNDEIIRSLSPVYRYMFIAYCCIAEHSGQLAGCLVDTTGRPYTQREMADKIGVSQATVYRAIRLFLNPKYGLLRQEEYGILKIPNYNRYNDIRHVSDITKIEHIQCDPDYNKNPVIEIRLTKLKRTWQVRYLDEHVRTMGYESIEDYIHTSARDNYSMERMREDLRNVSERTIRTYRKNLGYRRQLVYEDRDQKVA